MSDSIRAVIRGSWLLHLALVVLAVSFGGFSDRADAASVFMKNGYILQGPIVERDDTHVVLGYPNGTVTLARRFIETVNYEPGEEKRLEAEELLRRQAATEAVADVNAESLLAGSSDSLELPSTLEELMRIYNIQGQGDVQNPNSGTAGVGSTAPGSGDGAGSVEPIPDAVPATDVIPRPEDGLGVRAVDELRGVSVRPPMDWTVTSTEEALVAVGPDTPAGFSPSFNVVQFTGPDLSMDQYVQLLKEECQATLDDHELLREGPTQLGGKTAYQVVSRGRYEGTIAVVRQVLVVDGETVWLVSCFTQEEDGDGGDFALTEESLKTFEFSGS